MSTLKADTIVASDGTSPVTLTKQSAAKVFANFNGSTATLRSSLNVSSLDDDGVGLFGINLISSMNDANYCLSGGTGSSGSDVRHIEFAGNNLSPTTPSTTAYPVKTANSAGNALVDVFYTMSKAHGDLA